LKVFEDVVEAKNEFIVITSKCKTNCDEGVSKLNAVEIMPYEKKQKKEIKSLEKQLNCGNAFCWRKDVIKDLMFLIVSFPILVDK
jgi:hypothetical protein